jgi:hypothetical protein
MLKKNPSVRRAVVAVILSIASNTCASEERDIIMDFSRVIGKKWWHGPAVTVTEYKSFEPLCKLVMVNYVFHNVFWLDMNRPNPIFLKPEYRMGYKADWLHHYCDAKISRFRFIVSDARMPRYIYMEKWVSGMEYCAEAAKSTKHPYLNVLLTEWAEALYFDRKYTEAVQVSLEAVKLNPKYPKAYRMLAESYVKLGQKNEAVAALNAGLKISPDSKILINLLSDITSKPTSSNSNSQTTPVK